MTTARLATAVHVALCLALVALGWGCGGGAAAVPTWQRAGLGGAVRPEMGSPQPGEVVPELALPDLDGRQVSLASMRGSWVLVHFTATWCPFCDSEMKHLGELAAAFAPRGVKTVLVDVEEKESVWRAYAAGHVGPSVIALHDATGRTTARFAPPRAQPSFADRAEAVLDSTLLVDPSGVIRLFLLVDSAHFDPTFGGLRAELERLVPAPSGIEVVATASPARVAAGQRAELAVRLEIPAGYHVMSNQPSAPSYIATRVELDPQEGMVMSEPRYPPSSTFALGDATIATFDGRVDITIAVDVTASARPGPRRLSGAIRYQACTATRCFFPVTRPLALALTVL